MTTTAITDLVSSRLNEGAGAGGPQFYPTAEIIAAINEAQRLFCLLTLCLEQQTTLIIPPNTTFFHILPLVSDYIAPLRLTNSAGGKVRPARFSDLWALDAQWPLTIAPPKRYVTAGSDLMAVYGRSAAAVSVVLQYAGAPVQLTGTGGETPEIPGEFHQELVNYGIYRMRQVEGGAEFQATLPLLDHYLQAAQDYGNFVRARNVGAGYDTLPAELAGYDRSRLVGKNKDGSPRQVGKA